MKAPDVVAATVAVEGRSVRLNGENPRVLEFPAEEQPISAWASRGGGAWVIVRTGAAHEVREYSTSNEFERRLAIKPEDPQPKVIIASAGSDAIFLLEENERAQRLRGLSLALPAPPPGRKQTEQTEPLRSPQTSPAATAKAEPATGARNAERSPTSTAAETAAPTASTWKVFLEKSILFSPTLEAVKDRLKMPDGKPFSPEGKVKLKLRANPLDPGKPALAEVMIATDAEGSLLKLSDGLPLTHVTDTPHLKWAAIARGTEPGTLVLFQSDGAVVEQFTISELARMMSFDCGEFDYSPPGGKP